LANVLVDTGVWYAIFDPRDRPNDREAVSILAEQIQSMTSVIPWPITYETMCSRFAKNRLALEKFERLLKSSRVSFLDDAPYRKAALEHSFNSSLRSNRPLSLTDCLLRVVLDNPDTHIHYLASYNVRDFHDVCLRHRVGMLPQ
jgi:predicted nucleic acid-binding protein